LRYNIDSSAHLSARYDDRDTRSDASRPVDGAVRCVLSKMLPSSTRAPLRSGRVQFDPISDFPLSMQAKLAFTAISNSLPDSFSVRSPDGRGAGLYSSTDGIAPFIGDTIARYHNSCGSL